MTELLEGDSWKKYQRVKEVSEGDRSIRGQKKYQRATEVAEGDEKNIIREGDSWKSIRWATEVSEGGVMGGGGCTWGSTGDCAVDKIWLNYKYLKYQRKISEGDRSIRGWQKYLRVTEVSEGDSWKKYQRATEVSEGDRSIRGRQLKKYQRATEVAEGDGWKKYQRVTEVSEGDRSMRGRQLKKYQMATKVSEGERSIRGVMGGGGVYVRLNGRLRSW